MASVNEEDGMNEDVEPTAFLSPDDVDKWPTRPPRLSSDDRTELLREAMIENDLWTPEQVAGRNFAMGCVSLEITQRCNLDCSLCYLSDMAEAVHDLPLQEVYRRIDMIHDHFGAGTDVQISGGDPTLRKTEELKAIIARVAERNMRPSLFTNGIKAKRELLRELAASGLKDIAFHVDLTQNRKGYASERDLNEVRLDYIDRAKGLGLRILFNTTVFDGNVHAIPDLVRFFVDQARHIQLASFQLQADTGRGTKRSREATVSQERMMRDIESGVGSELDFGVPQIGHPSCNKYTGILVSGDVRVPLFDDRHLWSRLFDAAAPDQVRWQKDQIGALLSFVAHNPFLAMKAVVFGFGKILELWRGLLKTGRINKLSFFIHNFMDAQKLERDRCESCVFMVATGKGPVSMCVHNAKRDGYVLAPVKLGDNRFWDPLSNVVRDGLDQSDAIKASPHLIPMKKRKGRLRAAR